MDYTVTANHRSIEGWVRIPSSKSHTMRALLFASMAKGTSTLYGVLDSPDTEAMIQGCRALGARIEKEGTTCVIEGVAGEPKICVEEVDVGNSGQALRFLTALAALTSTPLRITGDVSIRTRRPLQPLIEGLTDLGARIKCLETPGKAPIIIQGPLQVGKTACEGQDSQPVSALLMACAFLPGTSEITVTQPGETPWIDLTLYWLRKRGFLCTQKGYCHYEIKGKKEIPAFQMQVPGDFSTAAFPLAAALVTQGSVTLENLDQNDVQGDKQLIPLLENMGMHCTYNGQYYKIEGGGSLQGGHVDINPLIDALPILAVLGCYSQNGIELSNAGIARQKESDRIQTMVQELTAMGAHIEEAPEGLKVYPSKLRGARVSSHQDHRVAMALAIAALGAEGTTTIEDVDCVRKTYPGFCQAMQALGVTMSERE